MTRRLWRAALLCCALLGLGGKATAAGEGERYLAIYLPGVYFAQLERKLELGNELAAHLGERLGPGYKLTPRVYATSEAMDAEAGHIVLGLLESPMVAARLSSLLPVAVSVAVGTYETRQVLLAAPAIRSLAALRTTRLVHAEALEKPQAFFDNFVFEGELSLGSDHLAATRDVASALSMVSLRKADALIVYEDDEALVQNAGLRTLYRTGMLPRPTLVSFDRRMPVAEIQRLRSTLTEQHSADPSERHSHNQNDNVLNGHARSFTTRSLPMIRAPVEDRLRTIDLLQHDEPRQPMWQRQLRQPQQIVRTPSQQLAVTVRAPYAQRQSCTARQIHLLKPQRQIPRRRLLSALIQDPDLVTRRDLFHQLLFVFDFDDLDGKPRPQPLFIFRTARQHPRIAQL